MHIAESAALKVRIAAPSEPGNAASAPGSAFNESTDASPGGVAGGVYASSQLQNSNNPHSVAQYDVGCLQMSQP
jgi:hypothetical protein